MFAYVITMLFSDLLDIGKYGGVLNSNAFFRWKRGAEASINLSVRANNAPLFILLFLIFGFHEKCRFNSLEFLHEETDILVCSSLLFCPLFQLPAVSNFAIA